MQADRQIDTTDLPPVEDACIVYVLSFLVHKPGWSGPHGSVWRRFAAPESHGTRPGAG